MNKKVIIPVSFLIVISITVSILVIYNKKPLSDLPNSTLAKISLVYFTKDFPFNNSILESCRKNKDKACLSIYNSAVEGKKELLSLPHNKALDLLLDRINERCSRDDWDQDPTRGCDGGIASLYFFNTPEDDDKIRHFFLNQSNILQHRIFRFSLFEWFYNRPDKSKWIQMIEGMNNFSDDEKDNIKYLFNSDETDHSIDMLE